MARMKSRSGHDAELRKFETLEALAVHVVIARKEEPHANLGRGDEPGGEELRALELEYEVDQLELVRLVNTDERQEEQEHARARVQGENEDAKRLRVSHVLPKRLLGR